jgi:hypothetical protein
MRENVDGRRAVTVLGDLRNKLLLGFGLGVAVVLGLVIFSDLRELSRTLESFAWELIPLILGLTLLNYALRFVKWHYYLGRIGARGVGLGSSLAIFLSGLTMAMTPGKVGELLKSVLLRRVAGTPVAASAPIVMAERLTDGVALLFLSASCEGKCPRRQRGRQAGPGLQAACSRVRPPASRGCRQDRRLRGNRPKEECSGRNRPPAAQP